MKNIRTAAVSLPVAITALWLVAEAGSFAGTEGLIAWRNLLVQWSGAVGIALMSVAMLLAVRPGWADRRLNGLDKGYRLHKWLGIGGLVISVAHWLFANGPKWLVQAGLLERPRRGPRVVPDEPLLAWLQSQRGLAEDLGEKAFYVAVALIAIALIKRFPYRRFVQTHRWIAVSYLVLVFHTLVLVKFEYWRQPVGIALLPLLAAGTVAAFFSLFRRIGSSRRVLGEVESVEWLPEARVSAVVVRLAGRWPGHEAGQFAFVTFHEAEGAHPFTIASGWAGDGRLRFLVKALGDYTSELPRTLKAGDPVTVEGPYGRFRFDGAAQRQVWIGAGIGITPFLARLAVLRAAPDGREIDLFHPTGPLDAEARQRLEESARAAGVRLHLWTTERDGRLDAARLREKVPGWRDAEYWFCGPAAFGAALRRDLTAAGVPSARFHQELFEMR